MDKATKIKIETVVGAAEPTSNHFKFSDSEKLVLNPATRTYTLRYAKNPIDHNILLTI